MILGFRTLSVGRCGRARPHPGDRRNKKPSDTHEFPCDFTRDPAITYHRGPRQTPAAQMRVRGGRPRVESHEPPALGWMQHARLPTTSSPAGTTIVGALYAPARVRFNVVYPQAINARYRTVYAYTSTFYACYRARDPAYEISQTAKSSVSPPHPKGRRDPMIDRSRGMRRSVGPIADQNYYASGRLKTTA